LQLSRSDLEADLQEDEDSKEPLQTWREAQEPQTSPKDIPVQKHKSRRAISGDEKSPRKKNQPLRKSRSFSNDKTTENDQEESLNSINHTEKSKFSPPKESQKNGKDSDRPKVQKNPSFLHRRYPTQEESLLTSGSEDYAFSQPELIQGERPSVNLRGATRNLSTPKNRPFKTSKNDTPTNSKTEAQEKKEKFIIKPADKVNIRRSRSFGENFSVDLINSKRVEIIYSKHRFVPPPTRPVPIPKELINVNYY